LPQTTDPAVVYRSLDLSDERSFSDEIVVCEERRDTNVEDVPQTKEKPPRLEDRRVIYARRLWI